MPVWLRNGCKWVWKGLFGLEVEQVGQVSFSPSVYLENSKSLKLEMHYFNWTGTKSERAVAFLECCHVSALRSREISGVSQSCQSAGLWRRQAGRSWHVVQYNSVWWRKPKTNSFLIYKVPYLQACLNYSSRKCLQLLFRTRVCPDLTLFLLPFKH